jgi:hypothetical protein
MAIIASNGQDPSQQQQGSGQSNLGGSGTISGSGGGAAWGSGASAYQAPRAPGAQASPPNIQQYLNANQGAGTNLSNAISNNVQNQANTVNQGINTSQSQLNNLYTPLNQQLQGGQQAANTAFQNPQALLTAYQNSQAGSTTAPNTTDLSNYNTFEGDIAGTNQYNTQQQQLQNYGQTGQQDTQNLQTQLGTLQQTTGSAANQMGQNALLQSTVGNSNYSAGQQALDSLFLQGQGNQLSQNLNNIYNQTNQTATNAQNDYQSKLAALQQLAGQNTSYAQNLFLNGPGTGTNAPSGEGLNQISSDVQNQYNSLSSTAAQQQAALQQAANTNNYTSAQLQALGLTSGQNTWGLNGQQLLTAGGYSPTAISAYDNGGAAQAATTDQMARYNALNQLAGGPAGTAQQSIFGSATTAGYNPITLNNPSGIQSAINTQQQAVTGSDFQNALQNTESALRNLSQNGMTYGNANTLAGQLQNASSPQQANQEIQSYLAALQAAGINNSTGEYSAVQNPWSNAYYNSVYEPDSTSAINVATPNNVGAYQGS